MPYKTITTYLPTVECLPNLLDAVTLIGKEDDVHAVGLHIIPRAFSIYGGVDYQMPIEVIELQEKAFRQTADEVHKAFDERSTWTGMSSEWRCVNAGHSDVTGDIIDQAVCSDLIVVGQEAEASIGTWRDLPAEIAIGSGRPVLTVPVANSINTIGRRILLAWNGSREAARAAFDALPLMKKAESVTVLAVEPDDDAGRNKVANGEEISLILSRHGVTSSVANVRDSGRTVAEEMAAQIADTKCDLLVMGCYGHSRIRESILGGATRDILRQMPVPVLFSH